MNLDDAGRAHADWKIKLRLAIDKQQALDAAKIGADDQCELGKFLSGEAKAQHGRLPAHAACCAKHAAFHREAGRVAAAINAGKYAEAAAMLDGKPYAAASFAVVAAIGVLKREAKL